MTPNKKKSSKKEPTTKELITALTAKVQNLEQQVNILSQLVQQLLTRPFQLGNPIPPYEVTWEIPSPLIVPMTPKNDNPIPDFKTIS